MLHTNPGYLPVVRMGSHRRIQILKRARCARSTWCGAAHAPCSKEPILECFTAPLRLRRVREGEAPLDPIGSKLLTPNGSAGASPSPATSRRPSSHLQGDD